MEPYVIRQGDYLLQVAHTFGFDADTVWNDDKNSDLARLRPDHNILRPGDILYIPDNKSRRMTLGVLEKIAAFGTGVGASALVYGVVH